MTQLGRSAVLALVSAGLLYLLASQAGLTWKDLFVSIREIPAWALASFVVLSGLNLALGAWKWLIVLRGFMCRAYMEPRLAEAMLTSALGELLGQVMPVQAGIAVARSLASKLGIGPSLRANLGTTLYEQLFDLIVVTVAAIFGLLGLFLHAEGLGWMMLISLSAISIIVISVQLPALLISQAHRGGRIFGKRKFVMELHAAATSPASSRPVILQLTLLSLTRYITNLSRLVVLLGGLGLWAQAVAAMIGLPLVQIIGVVPFTPGNLGITEWTWSAILVSSGATIEKAAMFAVAARVINVIALSILVTILASCLGVQSAMMNWSWRKNDG